MGRAYPAVQSLVKIGEPCIGEVIKKLSVADHVSEAKACLAVLAGLRDRPYVIGMLQKDVDRETDRKHIERLERAIDELMTKTEEKER